MHATREVLFAHLLRDEFWNTEKKRRPQGAPVQPKGTAQLCARCGTGKAFKKGLCKQCLTRKQREEAAAKEGN
jgi:uncharacterized protein (DUF983 family)